MAYELVHITGDSYMLAGGVNLGVYHRGQDKCTLIDSGLDDDAGKRAMNILKKEGWVIDSIINTHSHADHIGGNAIIQKRTNCDIYASSIEAAIIENPIFEPLCLFSAPPPTFLKNKFLMAKASKVTEIVATDKLNIQGTIFELIDLPGHSLGQIGVVSPDGVFYSGDAYLSEEIVNKHGFPFLQDIGASLRSLDYLKSTKFTYNVPCHGEVTKEIEEIINTNIKSIEGNVSFILEAVQQPKSTEEICQTIIRHHNIRLNPGQYYLTWSTLSAYLAHLHNQEYIECQFYEEQLKWHKLKSKG